MFHNWTETMMLSFKANQYIKCDVKHYYKESQVHKCRFQTPSAQNDKTKTWLKMCIYLQRYASVERYCLAQGGFTSLHFKLLCNCIRCSNSLYSAQCPFSKSTDYLVLTFWVSVYDNNKEFFF